MIVIVVGSDKSGKSTLVENLRARRGWPSVKFSKEDASLPIMLTAIQDATLLFPTIYDRFPYPDDLVYSPVVEGKPSSLERYSWSLERLLEIKEAVIVFLHANLVVITKRYASSGGDEYLPLNLVNDVFDGYVRFLKTTSLPYIEIDTSYRRPATVLKMASGFINKKLRRAK